MILDVLKPIADIVNKFIPDGTEKNRLQAELEKASLEVDKQRLSALSNMLGNQSFFVAGAIPSILWVLVISIINNYILIPWAALFGKTVPDVSLPGEVWNLAGWIITGLLAKKAVDGNAFYSKTGALLKPSKSTTSVNHLNGVNKESLSISEEPLVNSNLEYIEPEEITIEPDQKIIVKDQEYYDKRFEELTQKYN